MRNPIKGITLRISFLLVIPFLFVHCTTNDNRTSDPYGGLAIPIAKDKNEKSKHPTTKTIEAGEQR